MWLNQPLVLLTALSATANAAPELVSRKAQTAGDCPGYKATNVQDSGAELTADLTLAGTACNLYGKDLKDLKLQVEYQNGQWPQILCISC
jgi:alpha-glucosidase